MIQDPLVFLAAFLFPLPRAVPTVTIAVSSPSVWTLAGTRGEIREIWTGPPARIASHGAEPPRVLKVSAFGLVREGRLWKDLRNQAWDSQGSRPGRVLLSSRKAGARIEIRACRAAPFGPVFLLYTFRRARDFRFLLVPRKGGPPAGLPRRGPSRGEWTLQTRALGPLRVGTDPPGIRRSMERGGILLEVPSARRVLVCLQAGPGDLPPSRGKTWAAAWRDSLQGKWEDSRRVRVRTGLSGLDRLFDASVDAVEADRFRSGVIVAGSDGWYKNAWIRDGTYAVLGLDLAGHHREAGEFFRFWIREGGFSWGGTNEAQQPAIGIAGMWFHSRIAAGGRSFLAEVYPYVRKYAEYYARRVAEEGMIRTAEEWICQVPTRTAWPNAEIFGGLRAAARIARSLGRARDASRWDRAAASLRRALLETAYDPRLSRFIPLAGSPGEVYRSKSYPKSRHRNGPTRDERVDSGMFMLARMEVFGRGLGAVAPDDPRFGATQAWIHKVLYEPDGSISRFDGNPAVPFYPRGQWAVWPISACWAAQVEWLRGRMDRAWRHLLGGVVRKKGFDPARDAYQLPEQWHLDGTPVPTTHFLTWSHGEFLFTTLLLLTGLEVDPPGGADLALSPALPPGSEEVRVENLRFRGWRLDLRVRKAETPARKGQRVVLCRLSGHPEPGEATPSTLLVKGGGEVRALPPGGVLSFRAFPGRLRRYAFARERARAFLRILLGETLPRALEKAAPPALEGALRAAENRFDKDLMTTIRARRWKELGIRPR